MNSTDRGIALITGASSGIGQITARTLQRSGYRVFGTSRKASAQGQNGVTMLMCDVTDDDSVRAMVADLLAQAGRIDLLVNNAGVGLMGAAEESSTAQVQALFNVNLFGVTRVTNAVLPAMRRQGIGRIVNVSSMFGLVPFPYQALYASSKFAVEGYTESLDHEIRSFGIRAVLVEPGATRTNFEENLTRADAKLPVYDDMREQAEALLRGFIDKGDDPQIVANTILKAATATMPKLRYAAGKQSTQIGWLRRLLPASVFDRVLRRASKLPNA